MCFEKHHFCLAFLSRASLQMLSIHDKALCIGGRGLILWSPYQMTLRISLSISIGNRYTNASPSRTLWIYKLKSYGNVKFTKQDSSGWVSFLITMTKNPRESTLREEIPIPSVGLEENGPCLLDFTCLARTSWWWEYMTQALLYLRAGNRERQEEVKIFL